jgi:transposase
MTHCPADDAQQRWEGAGHQRHGPCHPGRVEVARRPRAAYGPHKTLYDRFVRWSRAGVFDRIFATLAAASTAPETVMINSAHLKAHRTAASLREKGLFPAPSDGPKAASTPSCTPSVRGTASHWYCSSPRARSAPGEAPRPSCERCRTPRSWSPTRASRRDWFRQALSDRDITPCIPGRKNRKAPVAYDTKIYKRRNLVERVVGRLKDWRRIATRYDRCAHTFMSAICIAATVNFWLWVLSLDK